MYPEEARVVLLSELNTQNAESSFLPWVEPYVTARIFPEELENPAVGDFDVITEEGAWPPAHPMSAVPGLSDMAWGVDDRWASNQSNSGTSWLTKFEPSLSDSLGDLREARQEASEKEFQRPCDAVLANAERILIEMYQVRRMRYEVYPLEDGEVAIDAPGEGSTSVFVSCEPDGSALCIVNVGGKNQLQRYSATTELPDDFLTRGLRSLVSTREIPG